MVNFNSIAVFILATSKPNMGGFKQDYASYFESRILPIANTWGSMFPNFYFVMGTNEFDYKFLKSRCVLEGQSRRLAAHVRQTASRDAIERYSCPLSEEERRLHEGNATASSSQPLYSRTKTINVLFTANCTGEYFGMGPTCRCQESMRYFAHEPSLSAAEWMLFMDDDTYVRPHSMLGLLDSLASGGTNAKLKTTEPLALVAPANLRTFSFSRSWKGVADCTVPGVHEFLLAQPAFLNRPAIAALGSALVANGLTTLQEVWGGSHDILLGVLLWLYDIPQYSFHSAYHGKEIYLDPTRTTIFHALTGPSKFIVHCVRNHLRYNRKVPLGAAAEVTSAVASQYNIAAMFGDVGMYTSAAVRTSQIEALEKEQWEAGSKTHLIRGVASDTDSQAPPPSEHSGVFRTVFNESAAQIRKTFRAFWPQDCPLL